MYLNLLREKPTKELFIKFAKLVAAATQEHGAGSSEDLRDVGPDSEFGESNDSKIQAANNSGYWYISNEENALIGKYVEELGVNKSNILFGISMPVFSLETTIFSKETMVQSGKEILENRISDLNEKRKILIKNEISNSIKETIEELTDIDQNISSSEQKAIIFELVALAYVDYDFSPLEKYVVRCIADIFNCDHELIDEMLEIVQAYSKLYSDGLEIITE